MVLIIDNLETKIFVPSFNVLFKGNASARITSLAARRRCRAAWVTAASGHLVSDRASGDACRLELFQALPANLLIHWVRLCSISFLAFALHSPFPYGHTVYPEPCVRVYFHQFSHWRSMCTHEILQYQ